MTGENLLHNLSIDPNGELVTRDYQPLKRGNLALQTDILVESDMIPLVVVWTNQPTVSKRFHKLRRQRGHSRREGEDYGTKKPK
ncbi:MAG: hypothetical protein JRN52_00815 [Nitrososphaerota archaeon]|nr:hypothetical protein [Nitrososphaerota archaeon]